MICSPAKQRGPTFLSTRETCPVLCLCLQVRQTGCTWCDGGEAEALTGDSRSLRLSLGAALAASGDLRTSFMAGFASAVSDYSILQRMLLPLQSPPVRKEPMTSQKRGATVCPSLVSHRAAAAELTISNT